MRTFLYKNGTSDVFLIKGVQVNLIFKPIKYDTDSGFARAG